MGISIPVMFTNKDEGDEDIIPGCYLLTLALTSNTLL